MDEINLSFSFGSRRKVLDNVISYRYQIPHIDCPQNRYGRVYFVDTSHTTKISYWIYIIPGLPASTDPRLRVLAMTRKSESNPHYPLAILGTQL